jgi:hypothetical protein
MSSPTCSGKKADPDPYAIAPAPVNVYPFKSTITGPCIAVEMVIAATFVVADEVKLPMTTYVPGAVTAKGSEEISMLAACAESTLNRPNAAIRSGLFNFIGTVALGLDQKKCNFE